METHRLNKVDAFVGTWGAVLCLFATYFWNWQILLGTFLGALFAFVNWTGFKYLMTRMVAARNQVRYGFFLAIKTVLILSIVALTVLFAPINMIAFIVGLSSLILGIFTHSIRIALLTGEAALKEDI
ncbi:MAG: hypothetical protein GY847_31045 [Proteobacteria bacterium]|nr:hypothetical protein [Pseudomonadota bacterium]